MSAFLRRAGAGSLPDGRCRVGWSVAEGARGRRWRWTLTAGEGSLVAVTLLELDGAGRFARLERGTLGGMLTLHPEPDGRSAHGNVVRAGGVEPLAIDWWADATLGFDDDWFGSAVTGWSGSGWIVAADLAVRRAEAGGGTLPEEAPHEAPLDLDERGIPVLVDAMEWALET